MQPGVRVDRAPAQLVGGRRARSAPDRQRCRPEVRECDGRSVDGLVRAGRRSARRARRSHDRQLRRRGRNTPSGNGGRDRRHSVAGLGGVQRSSVDAAGTDAAATHGAVDRGLDPARASSPSDCSAHASPHLSNTWPTPPTRSRPATTLAASPSRGVTKSAGSARPST